LADIAATWNYKELNAEGRQSKLQWRLRNTEMKGHVLRKVNMYIHGDCALFTLFTGEDFFTASTEPWWLSA